MKFDQKKSLIEKALAYFILPAFLVPLCLHLYLQNEIEQLEKALIYGFKYSLIPFFILFIAILYPIHKNLRITLYLSICYSLIYAGCTILPTLLINNHLGEHTDYTISGIVIEKGPGRGSGRFDLAPLTIRTIDEEVKLNLIRERRKYLVEGEYVSLKAKKGSLGFIYK